MEQGEVLLTRLGHSEPCSVDGCGQAAYWSWRQGGVRHVVCFACMRRMSAMNSDNAAFFADVLRWGVPAEHRRTGEA